MHRYQGLFRVGTAIDSRHGDNKRRGGLWGHSWSRELGAEDKWILYVGDSEEGKLAVPRSPYWADKAKGGMKESWEPRLQPEDVLYLFPDQ